MAFKLYDKDKDGYITRAEMVKLSKTLTKEQVEKVMILLWLEKFHKVINWQAFAKFDSDGDGKLSYQEFRKMMNK